MKLNGKVALITGGGSGIGKAAAILFAGEGVKVVIADYDAKAGEEAVAELRSTEGEALFIKADVSKSADVEKMFKVTIQSYGKLDILFNNAGIQQTYADVTKTSEEDWDRVIGINLKGVFLGMKHGIPHMLERGGVVINTASIAGLVGPPYISAYCASKGGVIQLTKSVALEYATRNIRINCVCPGRTLTPQFERMIAGSDFKAANPLKPPIPMDRLATPEEIARAVLFLASDDSSYITGSALIVDGGITAL